MLAFPGAEGFGAHTIGGRGGAVYQVANLNDSGPGSLREAVEASGPRTVVFRVGGTITLQSELAITNPFITIAGQTAPGGGITLKTDPLYKGIMFRIGASEAIVRYIRPRRGAHIGLGDNGKSFDISNPDEPISNIIADHCSVSWAVDETISTWYECHNITIQWCIISEGLYCSTHSVGCHGSGALIGSGGSRDISLHHNLFAHCPHRNGRIKTSGIVDFVNNIIYNPRFVNNGDWGPSHVSDEYAIVPVNYVGNYYKAGPDSGSADYLISGSTTGSGNGPAEIYVKGNITPLRPTDDLDEGQGVVRPAQIPWIVLARRLAPSISETSAPEAYAAILANAGCRLPMLDEVDERIINDVVNGTGSIIDDPSEVGGWPVLEFGTPYVDSDTDGMEDNWESLHGLDPSDPSDGPQIALSGYSNLENFINSIGDEMSVITDLQAIEIALRQEALDITAQADAVAQAITDLQAVDDVLDAAADVIEED